MPKFTIHHITKYTYQEPVRDSANQVLLFPVKDEFQEVISQQLVITGNPSVEIYKDYYGNTAGSFTNIEPHQELLIDSTIEVVTKENTLPVIPNTIEEQWAQLDQLNHTIPFIDFLVQKNFEQLGKVKEVAAIEAFRQMSVTDAAQKLNEYVYEHFSYIKGITTVETTPDEIWKLKAGVCQDFAHILLVMLRLIHIPARYVSGYVCPRNNDLRGEGATHAWVEAYIPFYGWLGLDPTNNCIVNDLHVRLAVGRSFYDCSPVRGTYKGTSVQTLEVGVSVRYEDGSNKRNAIPVLTPQPVAGNSTSQDGSNSYRRYMEMMQQQQ
jgi:transglutaminase-like putative cysteine protease